MVLGEATEGSISFFAAKRAASFAIQDIVNDFIQFLGPVVVLVVLVVVVVVVVVVIFEISIFEIVKRAEATKFI